MKKIFYMTLAALSLNLTGCYNDDDVWNAIDGQEERIAALEAWQKTANENIAALRAMANENDYITAVTPVTENGVTTGYTISFAHQGNVTIHYGESGDKGNKGDKGDKGETGNAGAQGPQGDKGDKGEAGATPVIGITRQTDGRWYWTLNGSLLKDAEGNTICAVGKDGANGSNGSSGSSAPTPEIKTDENGNVLLSVDGGSTWTQVNGKDGTDGDSFFAKEPEDKGGYWLFTLADNTEISLPKYSKLMLRYQLQGEEASIPVTGAVLNVPTGTAFDLLCQTESGCKWTHKRSAGNNWSITRKEEGLHFDAIQDAGSVTLYFTVTAEDNEAFFFQVTITAK